MHKDFAKHFTNKPPNRKKKKKIEHSSNFYKISLIFLGSLLILVIGAIIFAKIVKTTNNKQNQLATINNNKVNMTSTALTTHHKPQFDFYKVLPKFKVNNQIVKNLYNNSQFLLYLKTVPDHATAEQWKNKLIKLSVRLL